MCLVLAVNQPPVALFGLEDFSGITWEVPELVCMEDNVKVRDR